MSGHLDNAQMQAIDQYAPRDLGQNKDKQGQYRDMQGIKQAARTPFPMQLHQ